MSAPSAESAAGILAGAPVTSPAIEVTEDLVATLVDRGGYVHPLFAAPTPGAVRPMPGQGVLLLMGGLAEQSGALDHAIALLELRSVRFKAMVVAGTSLRVVVTPGVATPTSRGDKVVQDYTWTAVDADGTTLVEATAVMLLRPTPAPEGSTS